MSSKEKPDWRPVVAAVLALGVMLFFTLSSGKSSKWEQLPSIEPSATASVVAKPSTAASASASPAVVFAAGPPPFTVPAYQGPTIEEVEANFKAAYAFRGITSKELLHVMAVDWMQPGYKTTIVEAKMQADRGNFDEAIRLLEEARAKMDPEHLTAKIALLQAEEEIVRKAKRFDKLDALRVELEELRQQVVTMVLKAAKEGGLPDAEVKSIMGKLENRRKENDQAKRAADWLAGRKMADDDPIPATSPMPGMPSPTTETPKDPEDGKE